MIYSKLAVFLLSASVSCAYAATIPITQNNIFAEVSSYCNDPNNYDSPTYGDIEDWDTSQITSMSVLFANKVNCNPNISSWDVSKVTNFAQMFRSSSFNGNISAWDVSNAWSYGAMFFYAESFNQDISGWNVNPAANFDQMFNGARQFHQDLSSWPQSARDATLFCHSGAICDEASPNSPTKVPTKSPTNSPTGSPTTNPTKSPTNTPTSNPTTSPTTSVPAKFLLPPPQCSIDVTNTASVGDVTCNFSNIDSPSDATVSMSVKAFNCIADYESTPFGNTGVIANTAQDTGVTSFAAVANVDPASGYSGDVEFCVRTDLKDATGETMVFRSEQIKVTFTYNGVFEVAGFASTPFVGIGSVATSATKNFGVTATLCDSSGTTVSNPPPLALGTNLFVCIKTNVVGTKVPSITTFTAQKVGGDPYNVATPSPNVVIRGLGSSDVKIVMNLPARFFADSDEISLTGKVVVERDSRRRLARDLVEESENADFAVVVQVEDANNNADDSASVRKVMMSSFLVRVITLFFI